MSIFDKMTVIEAIEYCHEHRSEFLRATIMDGDTAEDAMNQYECLIGILESGHCLPANIPDYGMDFEDDFVIFDAGSVTSNLYSDEQRQNIAVDLENAGDYMHLHEDTQLFLKDILSKLK